MLKKSPAHQLFLIDESLIPIRFNNPRISKKALGSIYLRQLFDKLPALLGMGNLTVFLKISSSLLDYVPVPDDEIPDSLLHNLQYQAEPKQLSILCHRPFEWTRTSAPAARGGSSRRQGLSASRERVYIIRTIDISHIPCFFGEPLLIRTV